MVIKLSIDKKNVTIVGKNEYNVYYRGWEQEIRNIF